MNPETRLVHSAKDIPGLVAWIEVHLKDAPIEVRLSNPKQTRSMRQHRLYFLWVTEIANHLGLLKDDVHELCKRRYAVPIFTRDDPDYAEMVAAVKQIRKNGDDKTAEMLAKEISKLTSTTDFTVEQSSEYLKDIEHYAAEIGAPLTFPQDLYESR